MVVAHKTCRIENQEEKTFLPLNTVIEEFLQEIEAVNGILTIFSRHTTSCIKILEDEILSLVDLKEHLETVAPSNRHYHHDNIDLRDVPPDERINGEAHVRSLYFNHSEQIPIMHGDSALGEWQTVFLIDLDGPRTRTVVLTYVGTTTGTS